jgi:Transposase and inactivated derivatives
VRVIFALNACDREVMAFSPPLVGTAPTWRKASCWPALKNGLEMSKHCGRLNGSRTTDPVTQQKKITFAAALGIVSKFTPARSPQSNGMAEALVKTFKRDYVFCNNRPDAETVMAQLPGRFEDYNENAPHKALRILSPREFIRSVQNLKCPV